MAEFEAEAPGELPPFRLETGTTPTSATSCLSPNLQGWQSIWQIFGTRVSSISGGLASGNLC